MKKSACLILFAVMLILSSAIPGHAGGHYSFRGSVWIGPGWWGPPYPYYYPYYPYYSEPPAVIERQAPAYVQPNDQKPEQSYWYYCTKPQGYYPYIKKCPGGWLKVVPSAPSDRDANGDMGDNGSGQSDGKENYESAPKPDDRRY